MDKASGSYVSWDNTICNPLASPRQQALSAWEDGYASAKQEWQGLTRREFLDATQGLEDLEDCWMAIEAKLKEKNV